MSHREQWLSEAVVKIEERVFLEHDPTWRMPDRWAVTCGWAKGQSAGAVGVCVDPICSEAGVTELFITPTLSSSMLVLQVLSHEMIHAIAGIEEKHGGKFAEMCDALGFVGNYKQAIPGKETECFRELETILETLGPYPHAAMILKKKPVKPSNWIRLVSRHDEKYTLVISTKSIERFGVPRDPKSDELVFCDPSQDPRKRVFVIDERQPTLFPEVVNDNPGSETDSE